MIEIITPSRLHFGLIDLNGSLGRIDGGIGVALKKPNVNLMIEELEKSDRKDRTDRTEVIADERIAEIKNTINRINKHFNTKDAFRITVKSQIPDHVGLGSTTQLYLAIARGIAELNQIHPTAVELADICGRGGTSGIGISAFESGGFILDGGHSFGKGKEKQSYLPSSVSKARPAPILARYDLPPDWWFVCVTPRVGPKIYGSDEVNIFQKYCPIPRGETERISHLILMKILPSILEEDIEAFGSGLEGMQQVGFKKIELELQDPLIKGLIDKLSKDSYGSGMSSFGPTVYALALGVNHARELEESVRDFMMDRPYEFFYSNVNNKGTRVIRS